jgi:hypothetical protein
VLAEAVHAEVVVEDRVSADAGRSELVARQRQRLGELLADAGRVELRQALGADHVPDAVQAPAVAVDVHADADRPGRAAGGRRAHDLRQRAGPRFRARHGGDRVEALDAGLAGRVGVARAGVGEDVARVVVERRPRPVGPRRVMDQIARRALD